MDCIPKIEVIVKLFNESDSGIRKQLLSKLREIAHSESASLIEPKIKIRTRGRLSLKVDTSTRCDPSAIVLVESTQDSNSPAATVAMLVNSRTSLKKPMAGKINKLRVIRTGLLNADPFIEVFSIDM